MVSLYIENQLIELDKEVQFAITKTFEDITNPTSIINDWSKTVSIPFTDSNNETFGHIYNPDRITIHDEDLSTGLYFDPLKKLDFRLEWDSAVLMTGYAKMTSVTKTNGTGRYNITLNGELGKVFQEMKKITFDETKYVGEDKDKYWIDGVSYTGDLVINQDYVANLWNTEEVYTDDIFSSSNTIKFAPNNSLTEGFDYTIFQYNINSTEEFTEVLNNINFTTETGIEPKNIIPKGMLPREIGEYRSYLQLPYIHFYKLFLIFKHKFETITGYKIKLDESWFNEYNPYWNNLVYMLKMLDISKENLLINTYDMRFFNDVLGWNESSNVPTTTLYSTLKPMQQFSPEEKKPIVKWDIDVRPFNTNAIISTNKNYQLRLQTEAVYNNGNRNIFKLNPANALEITVNTNYIEVNPDNTYTFITSLGKTYLICDTEYTGNTDGYYKVIRIGEADNSNASFSRFFFDLPLGINLSNIIGDNFYSYISLDAKWVNNNDMIYNVTSKRVSDAWVRLYASDADFKITISEDVKRSNTHFTINDVWDNEYNIFEEILKYCKMYKILINVNDINKEVSFTPSVNFFNKYEILDWTDKLDVSKEYTIKPITFENKYILFNYKDSKSNLNADFKEKYGVNYGEYKLTTDYNFNTETKNLFDKIQTGIGVTPYILSWSSLYDYKEVTYSFPNEVYISTSDKDNKKVDIFGAYLFYNGLKDFDTDESLKLRKVKISDDTDYQVSYNTYCYTQSSDTTKTVTKFPELSNLYNNYFSTFNTPLFNYTSQTIPEVHYNIYTLFWKKYLDERYNTNNKLVTCYLHISPTDYMNFEFNKFIKIENQLYIVNKIYDYDITSNSSTKVDLVTIQDIEGYTTNNFELKYFKVYNKFGEIWDNEYDYIPLGENVGNSTSIYVSSNSDVTISIKEVESGDIDDLIINGVDALDIFHGYYSTVNAGNKVPIKFSVLSGGSDFRCIVTLTNKEGETIDITVVNIQ